MPWPTLSVWETARHPWVAFDHRLDHFVHQPELIEDVERGRRGSASDAVPRLRQTHSP
jgi:hypothetical protein